jgi:hypothetical protein
MDASTSSWLPIGSVPSVRVGPGLTALTPLGPNSAAHDLVSRVRRAAAAGEGDGGGPPDAAGRPGHQRGGSGEVGGGHEGPFPRDRSLFTGLRDLLWQGKSGLSNPVWL